MSIDFNKYLEYQDIGTESNVKRLAAEIADMNYDDFTKGDDYASLAKRYSEQGKKAMDDTIGQVSARTGGLASSYATSAANQAYNGYMEELEDAARALYDSKRQEKIDNLGISQSIWSDKVGNNQWQQQFDYNANNDSKQEARNNAEVMWRAGKTLSDEELEFLGIDREIEAAYIKYYEPEPEPEEPYTPILTKDEVTDIVYDYNKKNEFINDHIAKEYFTYYGQYPPNYYGDQYENVFKFVKANHANPINLAIYLDAQIQQMDTETEKVSYLSVFDRIAAQFGVNLEEAIQEAEAEKANREGTSPEGDTQKIKTTGAAGSSGHYMFVRD